MDFGDEIAFGDLLDNEEPLPENVERSKREILQAYFKRKDAMGPVKLTSSNELVCPFCGYVNLHQRIVEVFDRKEDREEGLHVKTDGQKVSVDRSLVGNPSSRRQGLTIAFECEHCRHDDKHPTLTIVQHKGTTYIEWSA